MVLLQKRTFSLFIALEIPILPSFIMSITVKMAIWLRLSAVTPQPSNYVSALVMTNKVIGGIINNWSR